VANLGARRIEVRWIVDDEFCDEQIRVLVNDGRRRMER
jgi:hypothetical protein